MTGPLSTSQSQAAHGALPTGTITFLFTDIEGSTRLWQQHPNEMKVALTEHDAMLSSVIQANGGYVFKTLGDAFCAAFSSAEDALHAALAVQLTLHSHDWGELGELRVRIAMDTGVAELRAGDYFGLPLNRVSRLLSAAHGGQILLTQATNDLVRGLVPAEASLHDLGEHRLRDLQFTERVFQLVSPGLSSEFPPLKTLDSHPNNLPPQLTSFIGRKREIAEVRQLLDITRLLTLIGTGGSGKTRLLLQVGFELIEQFKDGVCFVALAPISEPMLVATTIAQSLGVKEEGEQLLVDSLKAYLRDKEMLLLLDNFEQVVSAGPLVTDLLITCPYLKIIVTSRQALRLYGEHEYQVPPLSVPDPEAPHAVKDISQCEAVQLFVQRARSVKADFTLTEANAPHVTDICIRLDGLPLAIELASARIRILPPQAMLARLGSSLRLLTGGASNLPSRQQTLRNAIAWSYDLLDDDERALFRRMAVFVGGCTLEAAESILDPEEQTIQSLPLNEVKGPKLDLERSEGSKIQNILDGIASLVDKSLLRQVEGPDGDPRFLMLETIREYAAERLAESGEQDGLQRQHAGYFLELVETAEPQMRGPRQVEWLDRLEREHDNLRAALRWSITGHETETALRISAALLRFWFVRGYHSEGRQWLNEALSIPGRRTKDKGPISSFVLRPSSEDEAHYQTELSARAKALNTAGLLAYPQGEYTAAHTLLKESLDLFRKLGDKQNIAFVLNGLGIVVQQQGDYVQARSYLEQSLAMRKELGDKPGIATTLNNLGEIARSQGDYDAAQAIYEEGLAVLAEVGNKWDIASSLHNLAYVSHQQKDYGRAAALFIEGLAWYRELGLKTGIAASLAGLAGVAGAVGQPNRAARLFGVAERLREDIGAHVDRADRAAYDRNVAALRAQMAEADFIAAWAEGRIMPLDEALSINPEDIAPLSPSTLVPEVVKQKRKANAATAMVSAVDDLTKREVEVLRLVATGLTNPQVSTQLFLSHRTVEAHLHSIFGKLGVTTRGEAIRYALEHELV